MASSTSECDDDTREPCQFGSSCYRKNKDHLEKFKHPLKETQSSTKTIDKGSLRQQKLNVFFKRNNPEAREVKRKRQDSDEKEEEMEQASSSLESSDRAVSPCEKDESTSEINDQKDTESIQEENESVSTTSHHTKTKPHQEDSECETRSKSLEINKEECNRIIKKLLLVDMPEDFYHFWEFCKNLSPDSPQDALDSVDLQLVGPFDVLTGFIDESLNPASALRHWRYFYDPPEFQTVIRSTHANSFHIGYFRDEPDSLPVFVASNYASKNATISPIAENLFGAVDWCLKKSEKIATPFKKVKGSNIKTELHKWAKKHNYSLDSFTEKMRARDRKVVARTFHNAGIVVPYDKKTELGYRPLAETSSNLTKLLKHIDGSKNDEERKIYFSKLYEIVTWANIAMDEGDYGTCLELGLDLFSYGSQHLHKIILQLLPSAYNLLNRQAFATTIKAHLEDRKKGYALSAVSN